ncbi:MAG TPA: lysylphosphatidylglycerol synthase transmembrane domain-containing protein [Gemmatimonadales bacterium]|nr:lysylphosphatidylglycerol synthase transmembrane domain-containing protein [Gemmatimonadales bacterium]
MTRRAWITTALVLIASPFAIRFAWTFPWARSFDTLAGSDWRLLAAAGAATVLSMAFKAATWHLLLRPLAPSSFGTAQSATFVGAAVNSISVSVSGEAARAQLIATRTGISFGTAVASLVLTRIVETVALLIFLALALLAVPLWPGARNIGLALAGAAAVVILVFHLVPWSRWRGPVFSMVTPGSRGSLGGATALAVANWIAQWLGYHWCIAATHTATTAAVSLSTLVMANIAGIFRLTPGNIGVIQGSLILGMSAFAIPPASAMAAGLALQAVQVLPMLVIGVGILGMQGFRQLLARRAEAV